MTPTRFFEHLAGGVDLSTLGQRAAVVQNLALEAWLIHVRNLRDFLYNDKPRQNHDDVVAAEFFADPTIEWLPSRPPEPDRLAAERSRIHRALAHISWSRLRWTGDKKQWAFVQLTEDLWTALAAFKRALAPDRRAWFTFPEALVIVRP